MADSDQTDDSQKTEDPTPKRLEDSRKKGQVALSREINNWVMLLAATILIGTASPSVFRKLKDHMQGYFEHAAGLPGVPGGVGAVLESSFWTVLGILAMPLLVLIFAAFIGPFIQVGPLFAPESLKPDISKISPVKGFKRLFSTRSLMEFAKGILKISVISAIGVMLLSPFFGQVDHLVGLAIPQLLDETLALVIRLMMGVLVALIVIAVIDLLFQRTEHMKKMRMSKQELKDEYKQSEGDPHVRARLRQLRGERARQRMMQAVPQADVIITNPTHYSIALKYDPETMDAPVCVAKGIDEVAMRIREVAKEHNITLYESPPLARILFDTVDIDEMVPAEHYKAVAEVISYVFKLKGKIQ
ncbi:MAG: flagellar biosynthesis protein FlhB [Alphaproteobacteria bacterium CG_4_9_14_3_um_filter_47_13]|nr:MAG: flagellar biosynthesis protein FlhB [Alphaproteobacteria bacterium CG_4_9_14_3_um_filter_47_13]